MPNRPSIPAHLQRAVFVEAGHRCAVCGTPFPLERAHLVPWSRSGEHSVENLICLCANCHERADSDWDIKTLEEYKKRPWVARHPAGNPDVSEPTSVEITINLELREFDDAKQRLLRYALASFLNIHPDAVQVSDVRPGSVKVNIELPSAAAHRLVEAFESGDAGLRKRVEPLQLEDVRLEAQRRMSRRILIGVAGGSGSGKTLVARTIVRELGSDRVVLIDQDSYYKNLEDVPFIDRDVHNFDHPDAFDNELLKRHVRDLLQGRPIEQPIYDYSAHRRLPETRHVGEHLVVVLEGILIYVDPALRAMMDLKLFVDADPDARFIRRLRRDLLERGRSVDSVIRQYEESVGPMHIQFVEPSKRYADLIVPGAGHNQVAIDLVKSKVRELLREAGHDIESGVGRSGAQERVKRP